mmetsp:Transcript_6318/g.14640  ORF Transcript_6318/g.14640 Transcript_6318/m.14640 type:complete len:541 (+) Transcript_6318:3014-4636(+)
MGSARPGRTARVAVVRGVHSGDRGLRLPSVLRDQEVRVGRWDGRRQWRHDHHGAQVRLAQIRCPHPRLDRLHLPPSPLLPPPPPPLPPSALCQAGEAHAGGRRRAVRESAGGELRFEALLALLLHRLHRRARRQPHRPPCPSLHPQGLPGRAAGGGASGRAAVLADQVRELGHHGHAAGQGNRTPHGSAGSGDCGPQPVPQGHRDGQHAGAVAGAPEVHLRDDPGDVGRGGHGADEADGDVQAPDGAAEAGAHAEDRLGLGPRPAADRLLPARKVRQRDRRQLLAPPADVCRLRRPLDAWPPRRRLRVEPRRSHGQDLEPAGLGPEPARCGPVRALDVPDPACRRLAPSLVALGAAREVTAQHPTSGLAVRVAGRVSACGSLLAGRSWRERAVVGASAGGCERGEEERHAGVGLAWGAAGRQLDPAAGQRGGADQGQQLGPVDGSDNALAAGDAEPLHGAGDVVREPLRVPRALHVFPRHVPRHGRPRGLVPPTPLRHLALPEPVARRHYCRAHQRCRHPARVGRLAHPRPGTPPQRSRP